jgi:hypothetical protein
MNTVSEPNKQLLGYREVRQVSKTGKIFRNVFIGFNILMAIWLVDAWVKASMIVNSHPTSAAVAGAIATSMILFWWAAGAVVLGLLMRAMQGPKILIPINAETAIPEEQKTSQRTVTGLGNKQIVALIAFGMLGLIVLIGSMNTSPKQQTTTYACKSYYPTGACRY